MSLGRFTTRFNRRRLLQGALGGSLLATHAGLLSAAPSTPHELKYKGVAYDVGTNYEPGTLSRETWHRDAVLRDLRAIRDQLHCNSVSIFGTPIPRLMECATMALENGLQVWLQPRLMESTPQEMLDNLLKTAQAAEVVRQQHSRFHLNVGCELTLFTSGFVPGKDAFERIAGFGAAARNLPAIRRQLNAHLAKAREVARSAFKGPLTYGAGPWEGVDWTDFDFVALDYYMDKDNRSTYVRDLRAYQKLRKPIIINEFGCCTFEGAENAGGMGWDIVDQTKEPPALKGAYVRSEKVQADYIGRLLDIFEEQRVEGAFVYQFIDTALTHSPDPRYDLDMGSYALVKIHAKDAAQSETPPWEPKLAFHELARRYAPRAAPT